MLDPKEFKKNADPVVAWIDHYLNHITDFPVKSQVAPGEIYRAIPSEAPKEPEAMESDYEGPGQDYSARYHSLAAPGLPCLFSGQLIGGIVLAESLLRPSVLNA